MKFAIISDTHDNVANFTKALNWINKEGIQLVLHCGDITSQETVDEVLKSFQGEIKFVRGNGDFALDEIPEKIEMEADGKRIFFNHYPEISKKAAESGKYDIAFYGHTHKPWAEKIGKCILANPGEIAGQRFEPSFAVYDTKNEKLELKILKILS